MGEKLWLGVNRKGRCLCCLFPFLISFVSLVGWLVGWIERWWDNVVAGFLLLASHRVSLANPGWPQTQHSCLSLLHDEKKEACTTMSICQLCVKWKNSWKCPWTEKRANHRAGLFHSFSPKELHRNEWAREGFVIKIVLRNIWKSSFIISQNNLTWFFLPFGDDHFFLNLQIKFGLILSSDTWQLIKAAPSIIKWKEKNSQM